ncbi:LPS export ABC transporter ATP-binding protein [Candidatus Acetothermia bacterium]|jgi:lipopolysaccharide export system ATP-binding protein|nr:LPS export ABC transporter ATP-binding protein [Candidatus Acetothermia bacterium]MCI2431256.1 LPS export ABC transporter ATP-binding protein [Candidatus Acetothermia bacterium]MCI2436287.1 LPS export ABC transporter ATP-binding protein [Candidatus Acetothermia bacterium]
MILQTEALVKRYGRRLIVNGVSLHIPSGRVTGLLGPNGAGKTTTFYMITGLIAHESGEILLDGKPIGHWPFYRRARLGIHYLPQETSVFRKLSALENVLTVLERCEKSRAQRHARALALLQKLGIAHLAYQQADTLSAGERRRVEITRALATDPKFLLLDEPFSGIDPLSVAEIQQIIRQLAADGIGIIITDHNVRETLKVTDYAYLLNEGQILLSGTPAEIAAHALARRFYLGEDFQL